jgi:hypothetical protein
MVELLFALAKPTARYPFAFAANLHPPSSTYTPGENVKLAFPTHELFAREELSGVVD